MEKDEVRTSITGYIEKNYFSIFENIVNNYCQITEICIIKLHEIEFVIFRIKSKKQKLILVTKTLFSQYIERLKRDIYIRIGYKVEISSSVMLSIKWKMI